MPQPDQPYGPAPQAAPNQRSLRDLLAAARAGQAPTPGELAQAQAHARRRVAALAAGLGTDPSQAGEEALKAYEEALLLSMDLTMLGQELARRHGPAYLPLPGQHP